MGRGGCSANRTARGRVWRGSRVVGDGLQAQGTSHDTIKTYPYAKVKPAAAVLILAYGRFSSLSVSGAFQPRGRVGRNGSFNSEGWPCPVCSAEDVQRIARNLRWMAIRGLDTNGGANRLSGAVGGLFLGG